MRQELDKVIAYFAACGLVYGRWDLGRERLSLGGLLILRAELEQLAAMARVERIVLSIQGTPRETMRARSDSLLDVLRSQYSMTVDENIEVELAWPTPEHLSTPHFAYQAFDRSSQIYLASGIRPALHWDQGTLDSASAYRNATKGKLYTVHLKQVPGASIRESNADLTAWRTFFATNAKRDKRSFVLLGSDLIPEDIGTLSGVRLAREGGISLSVQLALVGISDGFMGMASGPSTAAVLSTVPYVILKNPSHHVAEMERELGVEESFPFSFPRQRLWRRPDSHDQLARAFQVLSTDVDE